MPFKDSGKPLSEIARELQVDALVEGSVTPSAESVSVRYSLIEAETNRIIRSGDESEDRSDFVEIQTKIANAISKEILGELAPKTEERLQLHPSDPVAAELYMKGLYLLNERESLDRAVNFLREAAEKEPGNALVHAYLAHAYLLSGSTGYGERSPVDTVPKAKDAAEKALERDNTLSQAHAAFAMASFSFDWDWSLAEEHLRKAVEADPEYATVYHWYGLFLAARGDLEESLEKISKAKELDPSSPLISAAMGRIFYYQKDYEQAERYYEEALELERDFIPGWLGLGLIHLVQGQYQEAVVNFQKALSPDAQQLVDALRLATQGSIGAEELRQVYEEAAGKAHYPFYLAVIACAAGLTEETFHWLDLAAEVKSEYLVYIAVDPLFDPLRQDPRYSELLAKIRLDAD
jgi:tetratricopeptide (TPR) repeat protein